MEKARTESLNPQLLDTLFSEETIEGMVAAVPENERPLQGLAGWIDWKLRGAITHALRRGDVSGKPGECAYLPVTQSGRTYHIILVGAGAAASPGRRGRLPEESLRVLTKNLASLKLTRVGASRADLGLSANELHGASVWIGD